MDLLDVTVVSQQISSEYFLTDCAYVGNYCPLIALFPICDLTAMQRQAVSYIKHQGLLTVYFRTPEK